MSLAPPPVPRALDVASKLAWPLAVVVVVAMTLAFLRAGASGAPSTVIEHSGADVVRELRALARLETAALHVEKVIDVRDHQKRLGGLVDANDALLFVASGEVVLGIDFGKLAEADVKLDAAKGTVDIMLPAPEVLSTRFDESRSYVHTRATDLLATRNEALESAARKDAIAAFEAAGKEPRAVALARRSAEAQVVAWGKALGRDVRVSWKDGAPKLGAVSPSEGAP